MKRKRNENQYEDPGQDQLSLVEANPSRLLNGQLEPQTPTKPRRGRPPGSKNRVRSAQDGGISNSSAPKTPTTNRQGTKQLATPSKSVRFIDDEVNVVPVWNADRSAQRKSARKLIESTISGPLSDDDEGRLAEGEDGLARSIWDGESTEEEESEDEPDTVNGEPDPGGSSQINTPTKRGRDRLKRPRRKPSPPPPQNLPPHERYFFQNRPGGNKSSSNTLASVALLNHDEYFSLIRNYIDPHEQEIDVLHGLHSRAFRQWHFEMNEGFSLCLYGWGSKRKLLLEFAEWLDDVQASETLDAASNEHGKIVVLNGYVSSVSIKSFLITVATAAFGPGHPYKIAGQPSQMLETLLVLLTEHVTHPLTLIIHSIDSPSLRGSTSQSLLARLASHEHIHLISSADHPNFLLLWDHALRETLNFAFHDATTFDPYDVEVDVVDSVNDLLGHSGRRVGGRDGVAYVLKSLPENARNLYRVLVSDQLARMDDGSDGSAPGEAAGIEYRVLYQKAVEEFICSNEMAFRSLLMEYVLVFLFPYPWMRKLNQVILTDDYLFIIDFTIIRWLLPRRMYLARSNYGSLFERKNLSLSSKIY